MRGCVREGDEVGRVARGRCVRGRGFTLIEVVIALALVIAAAGAMGLITGELARARAMAEDAAELDATASIVLDRVEAALLSAESIDAAGGAGVVGTSQSVRVWCRRQRGSDDPFLPAAGVVVEVAWDNDSGRVTLTERAGAEARAEVFSRALGRVRVRYFDGRGWADAWDSAARGLPRGVELAIWTRRREGMFDEPGPRPDRLRVIALVDAAAEETGAGGGA